VNGWLPDFERRAEPVASYGRFAARMAQSGAIALALVVISLAIGMNAAMLLGGMGPVHEPVTFGGKLFAGLYALYCGLVVILVAGLILGPVVHRVLHRFHVESRNG
jgi:hypothetical protein